MRAYNEIDRSTTSCIHFVYKSDFDEEVESDTVLLRRSFASVDIDCRDIDLRTLIPIIADGLGLESTDLEENDYVRFIDDLITKSYQVSGAFIILRNAGNALSARNINLLRIIEAVLIQLHTWLEQSKPFHLFIEID